MHQAADQAFRPDLLIYVRLESLTYVATQAGFQGGGVMLRCGKCLLGVLVLCFVAQTGWTKEPSRFSAATHEDGRLQFIEGLPVATVTGSPEEMGEQLGTLLKQPIAEMVRHQDEFARGLGLGQSAAFLRNGLAQVAGTMLGSFPDNQRRELTTIAKTAGVDTKVLTLGNVMYELSQFPACSTFGVEPARSATGGTLLGRNLDFPTFGFLDKYSLVIVYRPAGKHAFVSISFPGFVGVASGMNEAGLCVAQLEVDESAEPGPRFQFGGTPVAMCFRRLLEECATINEAEKLLREQKRMIMCNLAVCDLHEAAVLEITPKHVVRRSAENGLAMCTNHFRTATLCVDKHCWRFDRLQAGEKIDHLAIEDIGKLLNSANQQERTIQTMIFEPAKQRLHLSLGPAPASAQPLQVVNPFAKSRTNTSDSPGTATGASPRNTGG